MDRMSIRTFIASVLACAFAPVAVIGIGGCETGKGAGKDVRNDGEAGEHAINK